MDHGLFSSISGLYLPDARSNLPPSFDDQKCLQTLSDVLQESKSSLVKDL